MLDYVKEALKFLEKAFGPPVYLGERPQASFTDGSAAFLDRAHSILLDGQVTKGADALSEFYLGIIRRYRFQEEEEPFLHQMKRAHSLDPNWLEAVIAVRDGSEYVDPFSYPSWDLLVHGQASFPPSIIHSRESKIGKIDLVRFGSILIPVVIVKYPRAAFRTPLTENTKIDVLVNIDAVVPVMPALMHVLPVIFDDYDDPFWQNHYLNLFPIESEIGGIPNYFPSGYRPWLGRDIGRRFCQEPSRCTLFVLDEDNHLMLARQIDFEESRRERFLEMDQVMQNLGDRKVHHELWKQSMEIHSRAFCREIRNPDGKTIQIPNLRKFNLSPASRAVVFPVVAIKGKLLAKIEGENKSLSHRGQTNDVFISYSHADADWAEKVETWITRVWPFLKIFRTHPQDESLFREDPLYFWAEGIRSKCFLFLATPISIRRAWIEAELGGARDKPVITLLAGGTCFNDLRSLLEDLYCKIDPDLVADTATHEGWRHFAMLLSKVLYLDLPESIPKGPSLTVNEATTHQIQDGATSFFNDFRRIRNLKHQTESQAEALLRKLEQAYAARAEKEGVEKSWNRLPNETPGGRLATLLVTFTNEAEIKKILGLFPALVDRRLVAELEHVSQYAAQHVDRVDEEASRGFRRLLMIVREIVVGKKE